MGGVFESGETVICSATVKTSAGVLTDPATSMKITIYDPNDTVIVNDVAMTNDGVGLYHYDFASSSTYVMGTWEVYYTATDGTRISKTKDTFTLRH
jgi:uncharacterized protein YfaS (alpha-2-macroglobulin family)